MSEGLPYADIVILALIAGFILLRLRNVLGDKSGNNNPSYFQAPQMPVDKQETIVQLDDKSARLKKMEEPDHYLTTLTDPQITETITAIKNRDPQFTATHFLTGGRAAFEMVFDAFAKGDKPTLKMLLSDALYQTFVQEITAREAQENKTEHTLISVSAKDISQATQQNTLVHLTIHFVSEQVTLVRNSKGDIVEGDPSDIRHVEDHWTFERDITSKNPNWKVIET